MKKWIGGLVAAGLLAGSLSASNALTLFAQVNQIGTGTPYQWTNTGVGGVFGTAPSPLPVTFQFQLAIPRPFAPAIPALTPISALLTISAVDNGTMVGTTQPVQNLVFTIVAQNPADFYDAGSFAPSQNVLLQTTTSPLGDITGVVSNAFLDTDFLRGLVMSSDYLFINPTQNQTATWSFSNVNPAPLAADPINGILRTTLFGGNGNFSAHVSNIIPEPGAVALLIGFGVTGGLLATRRRAR